MSSCSTQVQEVNAEASKEACSPTKSLQTSTAENLDKSGDAANSEESLKGSQSSNAVPQSSAQLETDSSSPPATNSKDGAVKEGSSKSAQSGTTEQKKGDSHSSKSQTQEGEKQICSFFVKSGWCRFGRNCRYLHPQKKQSSAPVAQQATDSDHLTAPSATKDGESETKSGREKYAKASLSDSGPSQTTCRFFAKSGWCRFGYRCKFAHVIARAPRDAESNTIPQEDQSEAGDHLDDGVINDVTTSASRLSVEEDPDRQKVKQGRSTSSSQQKKSCHFYDNGFCRAGNRCRFLHGAKNDEVRQDPVDAQKNDEEPKQEAENEGDWQPARKSTVPMTSRPLAELKDGEASKMRETEINQLKKRFPGDRLDISSDDNPCYRFTVVPSDPDWPYDLSDFEVQFTFPPDYPIQPFEVSLPEDQILPTIILRHIMDASIEWLEARSATIKLSGRVELMVRPFLRWFDRSLMRLFTEGARKFKKEVYAKAAGFEFISYAKQEEQGKTDETTADAPAHPKEAFINQEMDEHRSDQQDGEDSDEEEDDEEDEEEGEDKEKGRRPELESRASAMSALSTSPQQDRFSPPPNSLKYESPTESRRGTEIRFPNLEMSESAATLTCHKITVRVQCSRCKDQNDLSVTPGVAMVLGCPKCQSQQAVGYRPCILHQFSSVLGFLDLTGCSPVDLILYKCGFKVSCLECSAETNVQGMQYGQGRLVWCSKCHQKMSIGTEPAKFTRLVASAPEGKTEVVVTKKERRVKDPVIREGLPLPANGACGHYKKSFRWLRFPCCGKCYPCDECHDLAELDHEMKYASRMICGFCAKEQPYSVEKPCISCGSSVTKSRTTHWEGGTGCRNRTKMSKNDKQKFSSLNKTVSRHAQKVEDFKKGKNKKK